MPAYKKGERVNYKPVGGRSSRPKIQTLKQNPYTYNATFRPAITYQPERRCHPRNCYPGRCVHDGQAGGSLRGGATLSGTLDGPLVYIASDLTVPD